MLTDLELYDDNGYVNIKKIIAENYPFTLIVGGRGTGKTYGVLKTMLEERIKFIYMRRQREEYMMIKKPDFSPFKTINRDLGYRIEPRPIVPNITGYFEIGDDKKPISDAIGYLTYIGAIDKVNGLDASDINWLIFEEFIPIEGSVVRKNESTSVYRIGETINRNRELIGKPPLKIIGIANSNYANNPVFMEMGLVNIAYKMQKDGRSIYKNKDKGLLLIFLNDSPISKSKENTAIYKMANGSRYHDMAISNKLDFDKYKNPVSLSLKGLIPIATFGEITFYQERSGRVYVSCHRTGASPLYQATKANQILFKKLHMWIFRAYLHNLVDFETVANEMIFLDIFV